MTKTSRLLARTMSGRDGMYARSIGRWLTTVNKIVKMNNE